jgi:dopamine receptor D2
MLALTWIISVAIAAPIALGVNYSHLRRPGDCAFFNSDFLIYSSMGSFYVPSIIMVLLYWRIYRALAIRAAKKSAATKHKAKIIVIENKATTNLVVSTNKNEPTVTTGLATSMDNGKISSYNTTIQHGRLGPTPYMEDASVSNVPTNTDSQEPDDDYRDDEDDSVPKSGGTSGEPEHAHEHEHNGVYDGEGELNRGDNSVYGGGELIMNPVAAEHERMEEAEAAATAAAQGCANASYNPCPATVEVETEFAVPTKASPKRPDTLLPLNSQQQLRTTTGPQPQGSVKKNGTPGKKEKKSTSKFNFRLRTSRKKRERSSSSRREKKATKTLAIVLGK